MYISSENNNYPFSNTVINIIDNTTVVAPVTVQRAKPRHNYLFPVSLPKGPTNEVIQFYPGDTSSYVSTFGSPSYIKNGIASEMIHKILGMSASGIGVYVINLKDPSATKAYATLCATVVTTIDGKQKTNASGELLYLTADGREVTESEGNTAIMIDTVEVTFDARQATTEAGIVTCKTENEIFAATEKIYSTKTIGKVTTTVYPLLSFYYSGNGLYGNNISLKFDSVKSEFKSTVYYRLTVQDGSDGSSTAYSANLSFNHDAEQFFVGNVINSIVPNISTIASNYIEDFFTSLRGTIGSTNFKTTDIFNINALIEKTAGNSIEVKSGVNSIDIGSHEAIKFKGGMDVSVGGTAKTFDEMAIAFFNGEVVQDITSLLRYRINQIVDIGYSPSVKKAISDFCNNRIRSTNATLAIGSETNFSSAIVDSNENYIGKSMNTRLLANCQSAMATSEYTKRLHVYPPTYFDTMAFIRCVIENGNPYTPFAGSRARWNNYREGSMMYPAEDSMIFTELTTARLNVVKKDSNSGAFLIDQAMTTPDISDLTEYSNTLLLSDMIYDTVELIHQNNWTFNEPEDVKAFKAKVDSDINELYSAHSASLSVEVYRVGETGLDARTTAIEISVDFKDIGKFTRLSFILNDLAGGN